jgi:outer membrane receptor protein involved in Fe transport
MFGGIARLVRLTILLGAALAVLAGPAAAGTTGKLTGRALDEKKQPLAGVNIRLEALRMGTTSDESGNYFIIGIPAGTYTVRASLLGRAPFAAANVTIAPDFTTELSFTLKTEALQMAEVRVEAERPLLQKDATGTTRFITGTDIQKLPTRGYRDAAAQQTGVVNFQRQIDNETQNSNTLIIRGGRPNETAYFVDGFSQQDPLTGTSSTGISNNAIEEVVVLTGGFAPEYGRIMSGAVNVVTRQGRKDYFGTFETVSDALAGDWIGAARQDYNIYDGSLGGPVLPGNDRLTFFVSGERRWQRDRAPTYTPQATRDEFVRLGLNPDYKPENSSGGYTFQGKLAWAPTDKLNFNLGTLGSQDKWQEYTHTYLYNLPHSPRYLDRNNSYTFTLNHVLSPATFYSAAVSYFATERKRGDGVYFDNLSALYGAAGGTDSTAASNPRFDTEVPLFYYAGRNLPGYIQRKSSYYGAQFSLTSQIDAHNQIKVGGDFQRHTLRLFQHYSATELGGQSPNVKDWNGYGYDLAFDWGPYTYFDAADSTFQTVQVVRGVHLKDQNGGRDGAKHPRDFSLYAQDKYEREGVIVAGGLRYDYLNTDTQALLDALHPLGGNSTLDNTDVVPSKTYQRVSPRLGIAFPVDVNTILRFNYGLFFQQPNLQDLYTSYRFLQYKVLNGGYFVGFGNPNLRPERTTAYEVGFQRQVGVGLRLDATGYYKDVKDLVEIVNIPAGSSRERGFNTYRNRDFATIKGVDIGLTLRPTSHFSGNMSYSLSYAVGTGSVSNTQSNIAWTVALPPKETAPLDYDQRHKLSMNLDWRLGKGEGPLILKRRLLENLGVNALFNVASGTPYTPTYTYNEVTLANVNLTPSGPINSRYGPWTSTLDLKADRQFKFGAFGVNAFVWVLNVLDTRNAIQVYTSTGAANTTGFLNTSEGQGSVQTAHDSGKDYAGQYQLAQENPINYGNPRLVRFGLRTDF